MVVGMATLLQDSVQQRVVHPDLRIDGHRVLANGAYAGRFRQAGNGWVFTDDFRYAFLHRDRGEAIQLLRDAHHQAKLHGVSLQRWLLHRRDE